MAGVHRLRTAAVRVCATLQLELAVLVSALGFALISYVFLFVKCSVTLVKQLPKSARNRLMS